MLPRNWKKEPQQRTYHMTAFPVQAMGRFERLHKRDWTHAGCDKKWPTLSGSRVNETIEAQQSLIEHLQAQLSKVSATPSELHGNHI